MIAEVKRVSPALGVLDADVDPAALALCYVARRRDRDLRADRATALGRVARDLAAVRDAVPSLPILCKDVIVDEYQIVQARAAGADAVLLIAEALSDRRVTALYRAR